MKKRKKIKIKTASKIGMTFGLQFAFFFFFARKAISGTPVGIH
jgi:hypothetical protein